MCHFKELQWEYANETFLSDTEIPQALSQLWMNFLFPETEAPVEMFTFSILLILLNLNKGNFNGDTLCYPLEHRSKKTHFSLHDNKTFPPLRVLSIHISCKSPQYSALSGILSVELKADI